MSTKDNIEELSGLVWKVLHGSPIDVIDEENDVVWENVMWELTSNRIGGMFAGTRFIGSGNVAVAMTLLQQKLIIKNKTNMATELFREILEHLQNEKLIRKIPEKVRETFKVVENGTN